MADERVGELHSVFDTGPSQHFYVSDGEDALTVGAWDFTFIPIFIHSTNQRDPLSLQLAIWQIQNNEKKEKRPFKERAKTSHEHKKNIFLHFYITSSHS